jgi:hypothetical protein
VEVAVNEVVSVPDAAPGAGLEIAAASARRRATAKRAARLAFQPTRLLFGALRRLPFGSFDVRCDLDLWARPHYAYGVQQAATLASSLGLPAVSVIEFGVAGGWGLLELERLAALASQATGVEVEVYGFDRGEGLPEPLDFRDLPYTWRDGFFTMDVAALRSQLTTAQLVLGDISETVTEFTARRLAAPVGFIAIDVDYYSSTRDALRIFDADRDLLLPRVLCYLDDIVGEDHVLHSEFVGELRAVAEFNAAREVVKIAPINGLANKRAVHAAWCASMFAAHIFDHPRYGQYVGPPAARQQLAL